MRRVFRAALMATTLACAGIAPCVATSVTAFVTGTVTSDGRPVANVAVTAAGNNATLKTTTDAKGHFSFPPLALGTYEVEARNGDLRALVRVDLDSDGAAITLALQRLKQIGEIVVARSLPIRGSGSDVTLNNTDLTRLPYDNSFPEMLVQLPGAVRGANGVVHINGDHGVIDYQINGVALPQGLNRDIGSEIDLNDISYVDVVEGAYPAQYGLKFGSVLNLTTKSGIGPPGVDNNTTFGSYAELNSTLDYHAPIAGGGGYVVSLGGWQTTRGLDPPDFQSPHNNASDVNQYAGIAIPAGGNNFTNLTLVHSYATFQIPNDVAYGEPAATDDNETQEDTFFSLQFRHALGDTGAITYGPALKISHIADFGDPVNDWIYGEALNVESGPFGNGGTSTDCATALTDRQLLPDDLRLFARGQPHRHRLYRAGRLLAAVRPARASRGRFVRSRAHQQRLQYHAAAKQLSRPDLDPGHAERSGDRRGRRAQRRQHVSIVRAGQLAAERSVGGRLRPALRFLYH